jgi:predicted HD superfamily hydrolase involved in NAD metabolism
MWNEEEIKAYVKDRLSEKRFNHVLGVCDTAVKMAECYGGSKKDANLAALLHDIAKKMSDEELIKLVSSKGYKLNSVEKNSPQLLHALAGAIIGRDEIGIDNEDVLNSVRYHTTGRENMSLLEKIIYISDYIEPSRNFPGVDELRKLSFENIDKALLLALENSIKYVIKKGELLHIDTIKARNFLIIEG